MLVAIVGGTGTLGRLVVDELVRRGHYVRILSRNPDATPGAAVHFRVDLSTGEGLTEALSGVQAVIDAANSRRLKDSPSVLLDGTTGLLAAEARSGVAHHLLISVVGVADVPFSYYRTKLAQENLVFEGALGWSIVRATQFCELLDGLFSSCARLGVVPRSRAPLQPVACREVAIALADGLEQGPSTDRRELAGPEVLTITELARLWSRAAGRRCIPLALPILGRAGRAARRGGLLGPDAERGSLTFAGWLKERYPESPAGTAGEHFA